MTPIGNQYGQALYALAAEEQLEDTIVQELDTLQSTFADVPEYIRLLSSPALSKQERCALLDEAFSGKLQPYVLNFLKLLTEKGYIRHFSDTCVAFRQLYNHAHGILPVIAVTAIPLTDVQSAKLQAKLAQLTGNTIRLTNRLDPECMGGVRLKYDGKCVDDTIAHRLDVMRKTLLNTVI